MNKDQEAILIEPAIQAVLKPILYADIFEFPLKAEEVYQFLECEASRTEVAIWLERAVERNVLMCEAGYYSLADRFHLAARRQTKEAASETLWAHAARYGLWMATLPFVRMVAVTGSLAVNNPRTECDDIDLLVVTRPRRLWLCRAMIILLVRYGHRQGVKLCPNYLITENALVFEENLFAARELIQMQPIYGKHFYDLICDSNEWVHRFFPQGNIRKLDKISRPLPSGQQLLKTVGELVLGGPIGNFLESRLQKIQVTKHARQASIHHSPDKMIFSADVCKGHYDGHEHRILSAYRQRVNAFGRNGML